MVSGVAPEAGSYAVVINYRAGDKSGSKSAIIKVLPDRSKTEFIVQASVTTIGLVIEYPGNLIFRVGQSFRIELVAAQGKGPYVWGFHDLPKGMSGDALKGAIEGKIEK